MYWKSNELRLKLIQNGTVDNTRSIERYTDTRVNVNLKEHQAYSLFYMTQLERQLITFNSMKLKTNIGVYSDCVGAGKSFTLLSLIGANPKTTESQIHEVHGVNNVYVCKEQYKVSNHTTLIVVPHSICKQWEEYIQEKTSFSYIKINSKKLIDSFDCNASNHEIVLISSSMYNEFIMKANVDDVRWNRVIFDEADTINIPSCIKPETNFTWFVTSSLQNLMFVNGYYYQVTPYSSLINSPYSRMNTATRHFVNGIKRSGYIKDVFRNLGPNSDHILSSIIVKNEDTFVQNSFQLEEPTREYIHCTNPVYMSIIDSVVNRQVLERLNAGDKTGAIEAMGCNVNTLSNIVDLVSEDIKQRLNNRESELSYVNSLTYSRVSDREQQAKRIKDIEEDISKLKEKMKDIEDKFNFYKNDLCPICMDTLDDPVACMTCCNNMFCVRCITECVKHKQSCPMCRAPVTSTSMNVIHDKKIERKNDRPTKIEALQNILKKRGDMKTLIFSSYDNTFNAIEKSLNDNKQKYCKISGNTNQINATIQKYKSGKVNILLLNSSHFGSGLNLQMTTDIIFFHKMSKDLEQQVIGRGQRYGRTSTLNLHFLCYDNEMVNNPVQ